MCHSHSYLENSVKLRNINTHSMINIPISMLLIGNFDDEILLPWNLLSSTDLKMTAMFSITKYFKPVYISV